MGMRQPAHSTPRPVYGLPEVLAQQHLEASSTRSGALLPLLILVVGLAIATVWFVGLPAVGRTPQPERTCEVILLESGAPQCVEKPTRGSQPAPQKTTSRVKR